MQPGDIVVYGNRKYVSKGCSSYGRALSLLTDGKPLMVSMKKIQLVRHKGGWVRRLRINRGRQKLTKRGLFGKITMLQKEPERRYHIR